MAKTLVGLYDDYTTARRVLDELEKVGFGNDHLRFASHDDGTTNYDMDPSRDATPEGLSRYGISDEESHFYAEGVRRGGALVIARVHDNDVEKAVDIMARHNPVRYEDRSSAYQKEGFKSYNTSSKPYSEEERLTERSRYDDTRAQRLKEIEENLKVGKREVVRGGVRVHKHVDHERVEETLRLRDETVDVDRKRVDRAATPAEMNEAFEEKTVEMVERDEEAVVEKEARVVGEVTVGKDVQMRDKTVSDTVRRTRIEVEKIAGEANKHVGAFREHFGTTYGHSDHSFDYYQPAYQYGYAAGSTYRDRDFNTVEKDLRDDYTKRHKDDDSTWDDVKDAVRHGYRRARTSVTS